MGVSFFESMVETHDFCDRSKFMYVLKKSVPVPGTCGVVFFLFESMLIPGY